MNIDYFTNDKYRVLSCMAERQIPVNENILIKLSQQEIANILNLSKVKVNSIIAELKADCYIVQSSPRGNYSLTEKSLKILKKVNSINEG